MRTEAPLVVCVTLALAAGGALAQSALPATIPATQASPATRPALTPERRAEIERVLADARGFEELKLRGTEELPAGVDPGDAVTLRIVDGLLVAEFQLPTKHGQYRLPVPPDGSARMTVRAFNDGVTSAVRFVDI